MVFPIHINIVDLVFKGMLIGMIASAPMGPVGILCVQRTLNKGRGFGFATGLGAAASDIIYAGITGFGMAFVMDFINNDQNKFYLQIIGSILLLAFGDMFLRCAVLAFFLVRFLTQLIIINKSAKQMKERRFHFDILLFDMYLPLVNLYAFTFGRRPGTQNYKWK